MAFEASNTAMVVGSTGLVGRHVVEQLTAQHSPVIALTRRRVADFPDGVEVPVRLPKGPVARRLPVPDAQPARCWI